MCRVFLSSGTEIGRGLNAWDIKPPTFLLTRFNNYQYFVLFLVRLSDHRLDHFQVPSSSDKRNFSSSRLSLHCCFSIRIRGYVYTQTAVADLKGEVYVCEGCSYSSNFYQCPKASQIKIQSKAKESTCYANVTSRQASCCSFHPAGWVLLSHFYTGILVLPLMVGNINAQLLESHVSR